MYVHNDASRKVEKLHHDLIKPLFVGCGLGREDEVVLSHDR